MAEFQVQIALEVAEDMPIADVTYRGQQVADVRRVNGEFRVNTYEVGAVPLDGLLDALSNARDRLI